LSFIQELKRRNVFKVAVAYFIVGWLVMQVTDTFAPALRLPEWFPSAVAFLLLLGFPVAVFFAWAFELTPDGIKRESEVESGQSVKIHNSRKLDRMIIVALLAVVAVLMLGRFLPGQVSPGAVTTADTSLEKPVQEPTAQTVDPGDEQSAPNPSTEDDSPESNSIAVLPFINMSSDPEQEYFSDGITEEVLNLLVKIPELKVTSRTSVFTFKDQNVDIPTVAAKLGVANILEGSVRKAGDRVRITAQLIEARNDVHLWSETYERKLDDIFAIQDEIAQEVVKALQIHLLGEAPSAASTNSEAYNLYLRGKHFETVRNLEGLESAVKAYQESIALDADFAPAWVGLSNALRKQGENGVTDLQEAMEASRRAAMQALELDNELAEAWLSLGEIQFYYDWDWSSAEVTVRKALEYGPQNAPVLRLGTWVAMSLGNMERALGLAQLAVDLDPLDYSGLGNLAFAYWSMGQLEKEERIYRRIMELYPDLGLHSMKSFLASTIARQGKPEEALQYLDLNSEHSWQRSISTLVLHSLGRHEEELRILQIMIDEYSQTWPYGVAMTYAWHGDLDKAFEWLDIAFEKKEGMMVQLMINHWLAPLHDDPRWEIILDKLGLLEYWKKSQAGPEEAEL
jgi:TolB-like protein